VQIARGKRDAGVAGTHAAGGVQSQRARRFAAPELRVLRKPPVVVTFVPLITKP
jgi:hypothetical protein